MSLQDSWCVPSGIEWAAPVAGYLLGSIPFGLVLVRAVKGVDLRTIGSGNIGATNAMRAAGKPVGYAVFALDFLKGFAPVMWLAPALALTSDRALSLEVLTGALAVLGHCFPLYLRLRGGKGVSTGYGALLAVHLWTALIGGLVWVVALFGLRYTGLASVLMGLSFPVISIAFGAPLRGPLVGGGLLLALLIVARHRSNIRRMLAGTEPKIGADKSPGDARMNPAGVERALVIGDGGWGTTLALLLARRGVPTVLWSHDPKYSEECRRARENVRFLPGVLLPEALAFSADPFSASEGVDLVVNAVPTQFLREIAGRFEDALPGGIALVSASKGLEIESLDPPSQILRDVLGVEEVCILTGPSHAEEVARGLPATVVAAAKDKRFAQRVQQAFTGDMFRVYTHTDPLGAELAGALKNVIALAAGISDGLGLGDNAKSALLTRGMLEMARYGVLRGGKRETFFGLAGIGDLVTTCCSKHSRNRAVGEAIGRGETLQAVLARMNMVAEGVWTTKALFGPEAETDGVSMPIAEQVHAVLFEEKSPREAVLDLMRREPSEEMKGLV